MWGIGIYFAENASYSNGYSFKNLDGTCSFFYAKVAVGQSILQTSNNTTKMPPLKSNIASQSGSTEERYDSIQGHTNGSDIFIIYENSRAYPHYLITYSNN